MNRAKGISSISDVEQLEKIHLADRELPKNVLDAISAGAENANGRDALIFVPDARDTQNTHHWQYKELIQEIISTAKGFKNISGTKAPVVSILLPNLPETHFCIWAAQSVGQVNPINPLLKAEQIAQIMQSAGTNILVTLSSVPGNDIFEKAIQAIKLIDDVDSIITVNPSKYVSGFKRISGTIISKFRTRSRNVNIYSYSSLKKHGENEQLIERKPHDIGALFHTGGTTGSPKIAQLTHENQIFVSWAAASNRFMEMNKSIFCALPLFHVNGVLVTGLLSWMNSATVILGPPQGFRSPGIFENFWKIVNQFKIGAFSAVPTVYQALLEQPIGNYDVSSLEFSICGAAPMSKGVLENFQSSTGITIIEGYGFTEGACISTINPGYGEQRVGSVGLRLPYQNLKILTETEQGFIAAPKKSGGVIAINGPNIFAGYKCKVDNEKSWIQYNGRRFFNTGDLGFVDDEGYLWLTGRKKELIIRGGHNIDPAVIENALLTHPAVELAAAVGSPNSRVGELPVAYVELKKNCSAHPHELLSYAVKHIYELAACPKEVIILPNMPITAVGKIYKPSLKEMEVDRIILKSLQEVLAPKEVKVKSKTKVGKGIVAFISSYSSQFSDKEKNIIKKCLSSYSLAWEIESEE